MSGKSFLAVDFGAGSLKLAEFEVNEAGGLRLKQYGLRALGAEGAQDSVREAVVQKALQELLGEKQIKARSVNVCAPGYHVFSKFVKLPPVEASKVTQIIQYEAQQNVPFPLAEVVWDYQILGTTPTGELEVLLVAIKAEVVEGLFRVAEAAGLNLQLTDVSAAALANAFRYNYGDPDECTLLLDIGAKTSNLLFFEKGKLFARSINLGANSITQDFAQEAKLKFDVAERLKIAEGFVSLGGAYAEPESAQQAAIAKIARQFMTRLHIQVNQTIQFYRGQQGGSAPQRLYLAGGASLMPYTAQFFAEKLNVPVEYFNPLRNVQIDAGVNLEELAKVAHALGEVVGAGLRNLANCPVELNLMPASTLRWQSFNQKKPYFMATLGSLVVVIVAIGFLFERLARLKEEESAVLEERLRPLQAREQAFKRAYGELKKLQADADQVTAWLSQRYFWANLLMDLRQALLRVEDQTKRKLGADTGVWIERFITYGQRAEGLPTEIPGMPSPEGGPAYPGGAYPGGFSEEARRAFMRRYGLEMMGRRGMPGMPAPPSAEPPAGPAPMPGPVPGPEAMPGQPVPPGMEGVPGVAPAATTDTNLIATVQITCRAVNLSHVTPTATTDIVYALLNELKRLPQLDPEETQSSGNLEVDEPTGTFTFGLTLKLKEPLKLF